MLWGDIFCALDRKCTTWHFLWLVSMTLLHFLAIIICQHGLLFEFCNKNTWGCEVAVYLYRWRYTCTIIYSSVQQFHMTSRYFIFQLLPSSARKRVYLVLYNTEDHTQRGWKYLLFVHSVFWLCCTYTVRVGGSRESVQVTLMFA